MESKKTKKKTKTKILIKIICIVVAWLAIVVVCNVVNSKIKNKKKELNGKFYYDENTQYEFDGKGKGNLYIENSKYEYKYKIDGNSLKIDFLDEKLIDANYSYKIDNSTLTLIGEEGTMGGEYILEKKE